VKSSRNLPAHVTDTWIDARVDDDHTIVIPPEDRTIVIPPRTPDDYAVALPGGGRLWFSPPESWLLRALEAMLGEAAVAQIWATIKGDAPTNPLTYDDILQAFRILMQEAQPKDWHDFAATQRKKQVAAIKREIAARAEELRRLGVRNPVEQAEEELAERWQHASGAALNRWLRRNR
jgi:hypothetical protein